MDHNLREILKLSIPEKIIVVEAIWDNIAAENSKYHITEEEYRILEERYQEYKTNPSNVLSWDEAKKSILGKL